MTGSKGEVDVVDALEVAGGDGLVERQPDGQRAVAVPVEAALDLAAESFKLGDDGVDGVLAVEVDVYDDAIRGFRAPG